MKNIAKHLSILGHLVTDKVIKFSGVATSVSFDLYGCIQVLVHPGIDNEGKLRDPLWFDIARLEITGDRVMPAPNFINDQTSIAKHLSILGHLVTDRVIKFSGVATSVSFDLYGHIQVLLHPGIDNEGKLRDPLWFDITRLEITGDRVMSVPNFINDQTSIAMGEKGAAEKPHPGRQNVVAQHQR
jgi:hypothetical protein